MTENAGNMPETVPTKSPIEANVGASFWYKGPKDTLPPPDMMGPYMRNRPIPVEVVEGRKVDHWQWHCRPCSSLLHDP